MWWLTLGLTCDTHNAKWTYSSTPRPVSDGSKSDLMRNKYAEMDGICTQIALISSEMFANENKRTVIDCFHLSLVAVTWYPCRSFFFFLTGLQPDGRCEKRQVNLFPIRHIWGSKLLSKNAILYVYRVLCPKIHTKKPGLSTRR